MPYPINSAFVPTTFVWDISEIYGMNINDPEQLREILVRLYQNLNRMQLLLNGKTDGTFMTINEQITGNNWFPNPALNYGTSTTATARPEYRTTINFGALPNTGTKSVPHNITCTAQTTFTQIYAVASDTTGKTYIPIPYVDIIVGADWIQLDVDSTNVNITTVSDRTNYNVTYVILEYLQT